MGTQTKIQVLVVRPGQAPVLEEHSTSLKAQQELVGGYIECVDAGDGVSMICNEDGKRKRLEPNFVVPHDVIVGTVFFCRIEDSENASIAATDVNRLTELVLKGRP